MKSSPLQSSSDTGESSVSVLLRDAQRRLRTLESAASHAQFAIVVTNIEGSIEWVNRAFTKLAGYSLQEVEGNSPWQFLRGPVTEVETVELIQARMAQQESVDVEVLYYDRDDNPYWAHLQIEPVFEGNELINFTWTLSDITEQINQASLLDGSEQIYRNLFSTTRDAIISLNENGFFDCNEAALEIFGYDSKEEFCRCHPADVSPEYQPDGSVSGEAIQRQVQEALEKGDVSFDWVYRKKDGTEFDAEVVLSRYQIEGGAVLQASVRDISERKAAEATLVDEKNAAENANQAKSEFLANMSHEIRTPLNAILGFTKVLRLNEYEAEEREDFLQHIHDSGTHLLGLINDILDLSKIEAGKMDFLQEEFDIWSVVQDVMSIFRVLARKKEIYMRAFAKTSIPKIVKGDAIRVKQLLTNLTGNALKFTERGRVNVSLAYHLSNSGAEGGRQSARLVLEVQDTGIGISRDSVGELFTPFNQLDNSITRRFGGTGLGLAISQRIVEGLNGQIEVESKKGIGSLFRVTLPLEHIEGVEMTNPFAITGKVTAKKTEEEPLHVFTSPNVEEAKSELPLEGVHILLCEDGQANRALVKHILSRVGVEVTEAENGLDGVRAIQKSPEEFDLILMDVQMPVMDGYTATSRMRALGYKKPIIALTAHAMRGDRERCLEAGCSSYLSKPIDFNGLLETIAGVTGR